MDKKQVILRAPLLTNSGYGVHSRQLFAWLFSRKDVDLTVECLKWGNTPWLLNEDMENGMIGKIMSCSKPFDDKKFDLSLQVQLPDEWNPELAKTNIGISALVETDKCNSDWVANCNRMDQIVVPSTFTKNVLKRSGIIKTPVTVIQEWYNPAVTNKSEISKCLNDDRFDTLSDTKFNFLVIGTLTSQLPEDDRKNLVNTIKWISEEFANNEDVGIVLKTNFGKGTAQDKMYCQEYLQSFKKDYLKRAHPKLRLLHGNMSSSQIAALYSHPNVKAYATATRGEGYGLPLIEAAAAGLPIIATNWSGHLEFLQKDLFSPVDYDLVEISKSRIDNRIFKEGFKWANPKEKSFKAQIRKTYEDYKSAKQNAKKLSKKVCHEFNKDAIKRKYDNLFERCDNK